MSNADARTVSRMPAIIITIDISIAESGPLREKSRSAARSFGKERRGVMQPNDPN